MAAPLAGQIIRASDSFGLLPFTPAFSDLTVGTGAVSEGWYVQAGDIVHWGFRVQLGTSPSMGAASVLLTLPVAAWTGGGNGLQAVLGGWNWRQSGGVHYNGRITVFSSTGLTGSFSMNITSGASPSVARIGNALPTVPAVDHVFSGGGTYRAQ